MLRLHKFKDLAFLTRDAFGILTNRDYFHRRVKLGQFFKDSRSYYVEIAYKADWKGQTADGLPLLFVPRANQRIVFPGMVLQYGLGCLDKYFSTGDIRWTEPIKRVYDWALSIASAEPFFPNRFQIISPKQVFYSDNSAMTQGEALSFIPRVVKHNVLEANRADAVNALRKTYEALARPAHEGGGTLYEGNGVILYEYCRTDNYIVLNGWVYAVFGLFDYLDVIDDPAARRLLDATVESLVRRLDEFIIPASGWSYYDNQGRRASFGYHVEHIRQLEAMHLLTGRDEFLNAAVRMKKG